MWAFSACEMALPASEVGQRLRARTGHQLHFLGGRSPFMPKNNMIQARASFEARYPNVLPGTLASRAAAH